MKRTLLMFLLIPLFLMVNGQNNFNIFENVIKIEKAVINTHKSDFGPAIVNNNLFYSIYSDNEAYKKNKFYNLYYSKLGNGGDIVGEKALILDSISEGFHTGPVSYCDKTKELFVTLSNFENPDKRNKIYVKSDIRLKIIIVKKIDNIWTIIEDFPYNDATYSVGHPAITKTGDTLFFVSNMPNGLGKTDLYMSIRNNGIWEKPINIEKLNTVNNEMFPTLWKNNLIFSTVNVNNNLDLFYSNLVDGVFSKPISIDQLNSEFDDFNLVIHPNETIGYLNTNSKEDIDDDIYKVTFKNKLKPKPELIPIPIEPEPEILVFDNIYYDFDKWNILPESEIELNKIINYMNDNPSFKVELGSHTDSRGSDKYNIILSQKISDSAVSYIVSHGISKDRIIAKGYGESQLVNRCDDGVMCTAAEHRKNRRTEIKILEK